MPKEKELNPIELLKQAYKKPQESGEEPAIIEIASKEPLDLFRQGYDKK